LKKAVKNFPLGYSQVKDWPYPIKQTDLERSSSTNLGQTAARMWLLAAILPLILSEWVSTDDDYWKCLSSLIEIMGISFATQITTETTIYLKTAIKEHLALFKVVYQLAPIIPKQHYLVHLPSQITEFGPLVRTWCMRHEGKHSFFKNLACKVKNYKNLPYTLAVQHQKIACADAISLDKDTDTSPLFQKEEAFGRKIEVIGEERQSAKTSIENAVHCQIQDQRIYTCNSITVCGTLYTPGKNTYLHIGNTKSGHPDIGRLIKIWHVPGTGSFFHVLKMELIALRSDLNSLELEEPGVPIYNTILCSSISSYQVLHCYGKEDKLFLYLRQYIFYDM